jgi:hypothetical protein
VENDVVLIFRVTADRRKREEYKERVRAVVARDRGYAPFLEIPAPAPWERGCWTPAGYAGRDRGAVAGAILT